MSGESDRARTVASLTEAEMAACSALLGELGHASGAFRFDVAPNPCVGAAVLSDGVEIGRGFHRVWGGSHAEIQAFDAAAQSGVSRERWDTLVVTLEPCSTQGKTPACTEAIAAERIRRVIVGALDPDPRHRGRGLEELSSRGFDVVLLRQAAPLERVSPHFVEWTRPDRLRRSRPWTIAKWAQTRTGQLLPPSELRERRWISGPEARAEVHRLRARVDAIVTGVGTVLADDPRLTVRGVGETGLGPLRVVLDSKLRTPSEARLFLPSSASEASGPVHLVTRAGFDAQRYRALHALGATIHALRPGDDGRPSLRELMSLLWASGVRRVLLEAGPTLTAAAFRDDLVDQIRVYTGAVNGGRGPALAEWLVPERLSQVAHGEVGVDARLDAFVRR